MILAVTCHGTVHKIVPFHGDNDPEDVPTTPDDVLAVVNELEEVNASRLDQENLMRQIELFQNLPDQCLRVRCDCIFLCICL